MLCCGCPGPNGADFPSRKKPAATRPLADIRANLIVAMRNRKSQDMERAYLEALSIKLPPTVNQIELGKLQSGIL